MQAERQVRIAEEKANLGPSNRLVEEEQLAKLLKPLNLGMREIKVGMRRDHAGALVADATSVAHAEAVADMWRQRVLHFAARCRRMATACSVR